MDADRLTGPTPSPSRVRVRFATSPSAVLFMVLFASQAGVLVLSPILSAIAADFGVSIARAGQLRILAAPLAAIAALAVSRALTRYSPRALMAVSSSLLALGSLASAAAPTFLSLALAQIPMWAGIAGLIASGMAATASWSKPEQRTRVVSYALAGPPTAWIVGMPIIGLVAEIHWRLAFLVLPLPAALLTLVALTGRPHDIPLARGASSLTGLLGRRDARSWALGELAANSAWAGTLVFSGALFTELYDMPLSTTGIILAVVAAGYLAGTQWAGRSAPDRAHRSMVQAGLAAAGVVALAWAFTPGVVVTAVALTAAAGTVAARMVFGTVHGFSVAGDRGREVGAVRAVTTQLGYLIGSLVGGVALAVGGFHLLAVAFGGLFVLSALTQLRLARHLPDSLAPAADAAPCR